jgi:hypothetical protein
MFTFFFLVNRSGLIDFCGTPTIIYFDKFGLDCRECFRLHEDGFYKGGKPIITKHPNILKSVLIGKKGLGLWFDQWSDGIVDWSFTKEEILNEFDKKGVEIPDSFLTEFENLIEKKKKIRNINYMNSLVYKK